MGIPRRRTRRRTRPTLARPRAARRPRVARHGAWRSRHVRRLTARATAWLIPGSLVVAMIFVGCLATGERHEAPLSRAEPVPEASPARAVDRNIRVRLCGRNGTESLRLRIGSAAVVRDAQHNRILEDFRGPTREQVVTAATERRSGIRIGARRYDTDEIVIEPTFDAALRVDGKTYRGSLTLRRSGKRVVVTNVVDLESYLRGVLGGELPRRFHAEAFAAQAVAARTYVLYQKQRFGGKRDYDVLPDERSQMYVGVAGEHAVVIQAVERTRGEVCTLPDAEGGGLFPTYYASACGGMSQPVRNAFTASEAFSPLAGGVRCDGCREAPHYRWPELRLTKSELTRRLAERFEAVAKLGRLSQITPVGATPDGRFVQVRLVGAGGKEALLCGEDFRLGVGGRTLKSTRCRMVSDRDGVVFYDGRGYGHGVGMCQYGADAMARRGYNYRDILAHYYPGAVIRTLE